jgi:14-3-3 protein epsilon
MVDSMKKIAHLGIELTVEERNLFSLAYKYVSDKRRESWATALALQHKEEAKGSEANQLDLETIHMYKHQIKHELGEICRDVMRLLDHHLLPYSMTVENKVFFYKM